MIYGVATDDGHSMEQHCNGWVMVNAENNVDAILEALNLPTDQWALVQTVVPRELRALAAE